MSPSDSTKNVKFERREGREKRHPWTEIEDLGNDTFRIKYPDICRHGWVYGGDFSVRSLFCAYKTVPNGMRINSFHSYFCSPGLAKPQQIKVYRLFESRSRVWRRVEVIQDDKIVYHAEFMFKMIDPKSFSDASIIKECEMPKVPEPSELLTSFELFQQLKASNFDMKTVKGVAFPDDMPNIEHKPCNGAQFLYGPDKQSLTQNLWLKYKLANFSNDPNFLDLVIIYFSDMSICYAGSMPFPRRIFRKIASTDLGVWVHMREGVDPFDYFLFENRCMNHLNKIALNMGRLWTKDGKLVATIVQESISDPEPLKNSKI